MVVHTSKLNIQNSKEMESSRSAWLPEDARHVGERPFPSYK